MKCLWPFIQQKLLAVYKKKKNYVRTFYRINWNSCLKLGAKSYSTPRPSTTFKKNAYTFLKSTIKLKYMLPNLGALLKIWISSATWKYLKNGLIL